MICFVRNAFCASSFSVSTGGMATKTFKLLSLFVNILLTENFGMHMCLRKNRRLPNASYVLNGPFTSDFFKFPRNSSTILKGLKFKVCDYLI
jgi:hypothetical protein